MVRLFHSIAGVLALLTIQTFWIATVTVELFGQTAAIVTVKALIPWGFILLIPALMAAGGSGFALARQCGAGLAAVKRKRIPLIALNGLLVLVPAALFLAFKARAEALDAVS